MCIRDSMYGSPYRYFTSIFLKEWKYGDGKKNRVRDIADSDSTKMCIRDRGNACKSILNMDRIYVIIRLLLFTRCLI